MVRPTVKSFTRLGTRLILAAALFLPACSERAVVEPPCSMARWHNNQGVAFMDQHNYIRAQEEFIKALDLSPEYSLAHTNLGIALYSLGRYDSAAVALEKAMTLDDTPLQAHYTMGLIIMAQGRNYERALQELETVAEAVPDDPYVLYYRGQVKAKLGEALAAIRDFERAIELDPLNVSAHYALANQHRELDRRDEWRATLTRFNELTIAGHEGVSSSYQGQGMYAEAIVDTRDPEPERADPRTPLSFAPPQALPDVDAPPRAAAVATLTDDARPSLITLGDRITIYSGATGAPLSRTTEVALDGMAEIRQLTAADWTNDGQPDLLLGGDGIFLLTREEDAWTDPATVAAQGNMAWLGDVDHDGDLDLVASTRDGLQLLINDGRGQVAPNGPKLAGALPASVVRFSDLNHNRAIDILAAGPQGLQVYANNRDGSFTETARQLGLPTEAAWVDLQVRDLNRDGFMDLLLLEPDGTVQLWANQNGRSFVKLQQINVPVGVARGLATADFGYDGDHDVVVFGDRGLWVLQGHAERLELIESPLLTGPVGWVQAVDWTGDGRMDLVADNHVLVNQTATGNWLRVQTIGLGSNSAGQGAKVEVKTRFRLLKQEVEGASPVTFGVGVVDSVEFVRVLWPSGVRQTELAAPVNQTLEITELDRKGTSCPVVYAWDGERFRFVSDINGAGIIGYPIGLDEYSVPRTEEYLPLGSVAPLDGYYTIQFGNHLEEVIYANALHLIAVDHPPDVRVFPNERMLSSPPYPAFELYALESLRPLPSIVDDQGRDVTDRLRTADNTWYDAFELTDIHGYAREYALELDLGDLSSVPAPVLLAYGWRDYAHSTNNWAAIQRGWTLSPPRLEVPDEEGGWRTICDDIGTPAGLPKHMLLDLTELLPPGVTRIRIRTNMAVYWDQFLIGNRRDVDMRVQRLKPAQAHLHWRGYPQHTAIHGTFAFEYHYDRLETQASWSTHSGRFTRYGPVEELLAEVDNRYVIMSHGDELTLRFDAAALQPLAQGLERSFMLYSDGYGKDMDLHSAHSLSVEPLPFRGMTRYPYGPEEVYPLDERTVDYLSRYNTRVKRGYF